MFTVSEQREIGILSGADEWLEIVERLRGEPYAWLLDSALECPGLGRYAFAGADPYLVLRAFGSRLELERRRDVRPDLGASPAVREGNPLLALRALLPPAPELCATSSPPFVGGAVGYLGYELLQHTLPVEPKSTNDPGIADLALLFVDRCLAYDARDRRLTALGLGFGASRAEARRRASAAAETGVARCTPCARPVDPAPRCAPDSAPPLEVARPFDEAGYADLVRTVKREIECGNVYQANLTQRLDVPFDGDAWRLYRALRRLNPAPVACFFALPELAIAGSSPERFLRVTPEGHVESRPIKGTRPRGRTPEEDARLRDELVRSDKERAENLMIVDLMRNDLGRVCATGSVAVPGLMRVEEYASVFQLVSTVTGRLEAGRDVVDLLCAAFPPGSMTGAPKLAAVRLLERLEPVRRGVYSGAIGYFDVRGGADLSVVIRSIVLRKGRASVHVGGGVVADSEPAAEYRETLDKARAPLQALAAECGRSLKEPA
jgi:para-aminobenzoate synthetase component 1